MKLSKQDNQLIYNLFSMSEKALLTFLYRYLKEKYGENKIHKNKDFIYAEGDNLVCLVAHLDTVHPVPVKQLFHDPEHKMLWSPQGLGADDRAGVFAIIKILEEEGFRPSIVFCTQEESGGQGARAFIKKFPKPAVGTNFLIELDRQGEKDAVFYECDNPDFEKFITSFGFTTEYGTFSDISIIAPKWKIAAVNLSIGYYNEHTAREFLYYEQTFNTINKVCRILANDNKYFKYIPMVTNFYNNPWFKPLYNEHFCFCDGCNKMLSIDSCIPVPFDGDIFNVCPDCAEDLVGWCENCGAAFIKLTDNAKLCQQCAEDNK